VTCFSSAAAQDWQYGCSERRSDVSCWRPQRSQNNAARRMVPKIKKHAHTHRKPSSATTSTRAPAELKHVRRLTKPLATARNLHIPQRECLVIMSSYYCICVLILSHSHATTYVSSYSILSYYYMYPHTTIARRWCSQQRVRGGGGGGGRAWRRGRRWVGRGPAEACQGAIQIAAQQSRSLRAP